MATCPTDPGDEEYEYEYHETETETFLLDVDLSSLNSKDKSCNPRKHRKKSPGNSSGLIRHISNDDLSSATEEDESHPEASGELKKPKRSRGRPKQTLKSLQILDLTTSSPLVSYNNEVYDCSWIDMVGTNMFFTLPAAPSSAKAARSDQTPTLTGTSRIKIAGSRAKVSKAEPQKRKHGQLEADVSTNENGLPVPASHRTQSTFDTKEQASFLEKLMDVKKRRGERDFGTVIPGSGTEDQSKTAPVNTEK